MNALTIAVLVLAQARPHTYTPGNVLHPGGVPQQAPANAPIAPMGGYGQPRPQRAGGGGGGGGRSGHARSVVSVPVLVAVPFFEAPVGQQEAPANGVIVNPNYQPQASNPVLQDYSNAGLRESPSFEQRQTDPPRALMQDADQSPTFHLIALTNGTIVAAIGYWMDGDTLNYITRDGNRNRVSMDRVDYEFSVKLNAGRNLEFKLQ